MVCLKQIQLGIKYGDGGWWWDPISDLVRIWSPTCPALNLCPTARSRSGCNAPTTSPWWRRRDRRRILHDGSMRLGRCLNPKLYQVIYNPKLLLILVGFILYTPSYINVINWFIIPSIGSSNWIICCIYIYMHFIPGWWGYVLCQLGYYFLKEYGDHHHMFIRTFGALVFCHILYIYLLSFIYI